MRLFVILLSLSLGILIVSPSRAQRRSVGSLVLSPAVQTELVLHGDDYFFVGAQGPLRTGGYEGGVHLSNVNLTSGYERFWNTSWSGGATLQLNGYSAVNSSRAKHIVFDVAPEVFVRQWIALGAFNFRQRLGLEYDVSAGNAKSRALTRLRLDIDRLVPVGERLVLRPRLAYESAVYLRFQRAEDEPRERVIDFGSLRGEVGVRLNDHFDITPWVGSATAYTFTLPQTDASGKVVIPGGRRNLVTPTVGLDLRFTILNGMQVTGRRQLPTQH